MTEQEKQALRAAVLAMDGAHWREKTYCAGDGEKVGSYGDKRRAYYFGRALTIQAIKAFDNIDSAKQWMEEQWADELITTGGAAKHDRSTTGT